MKLSTKGRYAVSAMFHLAAHSQGQPVSAADIAAAQHMPLAYLEQLLAKLRRAGLLRTVRGPSGGYVLKDKPEKISIGMIIRAADGPVALADCVSAEGKCQRSGCCSTMMLWKKLSAKVSRVFDSTTLKDLCREAGK
ncbi:MAG: Rrf2 family transcriptional regulator [Candidatus Saganbacteria bacterium]|nr:Rrf2 family transcriptional regulator [Candidatus Saganbacteria bacterium]